MGFSRTPPLSRGEVMSRAFSVFAIGLLASPSLAAPPEAQVKAAIAKGASYLKSSYGKGGANDSHGTGPDALVGLALLEAGVSKGDATVLKIASTIRAKSPGEGGTYQNSLALLFLDRLGDTGDEARIQRLGTRLYLGMLSSGGFDYQLPALPESAASPPRPSLSADKNDGFLKVEPKAGAPRAGVAGLTPEVAPQFAAVRQLLLAGGRKSGAGDNSNTQFGLIALWVARRHGVPVDDALDLIGKRFLSSQSAADGGWAYTPGSGGSTPAMTCAGVLGLAVSAPPPPAPPKDARAGDPFYNPPAGKSRETPRASPNAAATRAGLVSLTRLVATVPPTNLKSFSGLGDEYYTLWSLERACVALGLDSLGGADWHAWGCEFLLPAQKSDGSWQGQYGVDVSTSFAMLFLLRANFTKDLTDRLKPKPTADAVLRGGLGFNAAARPDDTTPGLGAGGEPVPAAPEVAQLVEALTKPGTFAATLAECRTGRGSAYTAAMVRAMPKLAEAERQTARSALAERLTRMTANTLKSQLADPEPELRRAAAVAAGVKREAELAPSLADRAADADDEVAQAARLALRIISGRDFGPQPGADAAAKQKARGDWVKWAIANAR